MYFNLYNQLYTFVPFLRDYSKSLCQVALCKTTLCPMTMSNDTDPFWCIMLASFQEIITAETSIARDNVWNFKSHPFWSTLTSLGIIDTVSNGRKQRKKRTTSKPVSSQLNETHLDILLRNVTGGHAMTTNMLGFPEHSWRQQLTGQPTPLLPVVMKFNWFIACCAELSCAGRLPPDISTSHM